MILTAVPVTPNPTSAPTNGGSPLTGDPAFAAALNSGNGDHIGFVYYDFEAYWVPRGYAQEAPIKTQCRIDVPRTGMAVPAGRQYIAGVAWAQTKGISKVEVKVDDGPWQEAELAPELSEETWRQWRLRWDPQPGSARITCRAADAAGDLMPEERSEPLPDGATGWQSKLVIVQAA